MDKKFEATYRVAYEIDIILMYLKDIKHNPRETKKNP